MALDSGNNNHPVKAAGTLYIIATPIGNLGDITYRAVETLKEVDIIACEDTRKAGILAQKFDLKAKRISYFDHNSKLRDKELLKYLNSGKNIALISEAGSPLISDPGFTLVNTCIDNDIDVLSIPGPTALISALTVSGLPADRFTFEGFLPPKKGRNKRLESLKDLKHTLIFYESPHRISKLLNELREKFGNRRVVLVREMTKKFEEVIRTTLDEAVNLYAEKKPKGEFVIILEGSKTKK